MNAGQITLLVFALLMEAGGVLGFKVAKSKVSLFSGLASGGLLFAAFVLTFFEMTAGLWMGAGVAALLVLVFVIRVTKTGKLMPSGVLLAVSIVAGAILVQQALSVG